MRAAPRFVPVYDVWLRILRQLRRLPEAEAALADLRKGAPANAAIPHAFGVCRILQGRVPDAIPYFEEALRLDPASMDSAFALHFARYEAQDYPGAFEALKRVEALADPDDVDWRYYISGRQGIIHKDMGNHPAALPLLALAARTANELGDRRRQLHFQSQLATVYGHVGDYPQAFATAELALTVARELKDRLSEGRIQGQLARFHSALSAYTRAIEHYQQAIDLARQMGDKASEADQLKGLADILAASGKPKQALESVDQALAITRERNNKWTQARYLVSKATIERSLGETAKALETSSEAQRLAHEMADDFGEADGALRSSELEWQLGRKAQARERAQHALTLARGGGAKLLEARSLNALARMERQSNQGTEALAHDEAALAIAGQIHLPELLWSSHAGLADTHFAAARSELALPHYRLAIEALEKMRARLSRAEDRARYLSDKREIYQRAISVLVRLHAQYPARGYDAEAFHFAERAKARSYLETIAESRGDRAVGADLTTLAREQDLRGRISSIQTRLATAPAAASVRATVPSLHRELAQAEQEHDLFLWQQAKVAAGGVQNLQPLGLAEVQGRLGMRRVLLEYALGEGESFLFAVSARRLRIVRLPAVAQITRAVREVRAAITESPSTLRLGAFAVAAQGLYRDLVHPATPLLANQLELVIVPDGILHYLPFEVLLTAAPAGALDVTNLPYLLRVRTLSYAPSMSVLAALESIPRSSRGAKLLGYGDPLPAGQLPYSRRKIAEIAKLFPDATVRTRAEATEASFKKDPALANYTVLHFAVHGLLHPSRPPLSALALSRDGGPEDSLLQVYEIVNLKLGADLVVMSACETALGENLPGEGLAGLAQSFIYADGASVAASLWKVEDAATAGLMVEFHRQRRATLNSASALRQAKLAHIRGSRYAHPYFWAGFVLSGRTTPDGQVLRPILR